MTHVHRALRAAVPAFLLLAAQSACERAEEGGVVTGGAGEPATPPIAAPTQTADAVSMWALDDGRDFEPLPTPAPGDWLDVHREPGQSFAGFVRSGPNRPDETRSDSRPLHMCPDDLRKLQWSVGFDVVERYRGLAVLYREIGFDDEAAWIDRRLRRISNADATRGDL